MKILTNRWFLAFLGLFLTLLGVDVMAAVPAVVGTTLTSIQTDATDTVNALFPVVGTIMSLFVIIKIFKRGVNKI
jgi:hypothetical protein